MNVVTLLGNLGSDPELRLTQGGQAICKIRLATTESYLDRTNTRQERTEWHSVTVFGKRGEALAKMVQKGTRLCVMGRLSTTSYEKDNEKRYRTEVIATNFYLCSSLPRDDSSRASDYAGRPPPAPPGRREGAANNRAAGEDARRQATSNGNDLDYGPGDFDDDDTPF